MKATGWSIVEREFDAVKPHHHERVFTLGSAYLCTRGSFEEGVKRCATSGNTQLFAPILCTRGVVWKL